MRKTTLIPCFLSLLLVFSVAAADGPVAPGSLPGGVAVVDSDDGNGEAWGRTGGRTLGFTVADLPRFTRLDWGAIPTGAVGIAFDGAVNSGAEFLTFDAGESSLDAGVAVWTGSAVIELLTPTRHSETLPTRFVLTVTDGFSNPVALRFVAGEVSPGLDVIAALGQFSVNMRMQSRHSSYSGDWAPVLNMFDYLHTNTNEPGGGGLAVTEFFHGFWFSTTSGAGMTLEEHDSNIQARAATIDNAHERIEIEIAGLGNGINAVHGAVATLPTTINERFQDVMSGLGGLEGSVETAQQDLTNILLALFNIEIDPDTGQPVDPGAIVLITHLARQADLEALAGAVAQVQTQLDEVQGAADTIECEVVALPGRMNALRQWIMLTSRGGLPADCMLTELLAVDLNGVGAVGVTDVTAYAMTNWIASGMLRVDLNLNTWRWPGPYAFRFQMTCDDGSGERYGTAMFRE